VLAMAAVAAVIAAVIAAVVAVVHIILALAAAPPPPAPRVRGLRQALHAVRRPSALPSCRCRPRSTLIWRCHWEALLPGSAQGGGGVLLRKLADWKSSEGFRYEATPLDPTPHREEEESSSASWPTGSLFSLRRVSVHSA
jgi:hypothetical protein